MHLPIGRPLLQEIELGVNKELVAFSAAAGALVALSRRLRESVDVPEFSKQLAATFDEEAYQFVTTLRNVICHQEFPDMSWKICALNIKAGSSKQSAILGCLGTSL